MNLFKLRERKNVPPVATPSEPEMIPAPVVETPEERLESMDPTTLMAKIATITADYNQVRDQLQQRLFDQLDALEATQQGDEATLRRVRQKRDQVTEDVAKLQVVDTATLDERLAANQVQVTRCESQSAQEEAALKQADDGLAVLQQQADDLKAQLHALEEDSRALTEKMRSETDPLKIVNIVDATRTQAEKNAQKHKQLDADLTALTREQAAQRDARATQLAALEAVKTQLTQHQTTQSQLQTERDTVISANAKALTAARAQLKQLQQQQVALEKAIADRQQELMRAEHRLREWFGSIHRVNALPLDEGMFVFALDSFLPKEAAQLATLVTYLLTAGAAKVGIYSSYFDINLRSELQRWAAQYDIDIAKIEIINPLLQLQASDAAITPTKIQLPEAASESWNADHTQLELHMSDPQLVLRVQYDAAQISDITYLNAGQPVKHSFFSRQGHLLANALFDAQGALKQEEYYRQDGILALTIMYADGKQNSVEVFDQNGVLRRAFNNTEALITWWQKGAFTEETRLVGRFQHPAYTALLAQSQATAVPYLEPDDVARAHFTATLKDTETTAFIVADYAVAQALIRTADRDLHLLQLDDVNLPFRIASPTVTP